MNHTKLKDVGSPGSGAALRGYMLRPTVSDMHRGSDFEVFFLFSPQPLWLGVQEPEVGVPGRSSYITSLHGVFLHVGPTVLTLFPHVKTPPETGL